jgi:hypothetical protein
VSCARGGQHIHASLRNLPTWVALITGKGGIIHLCAPCHSSEVSLEPHA